MFLYTARFHKKTTLALILAVIISVGGLLIWNAHTSNSVQTPTLCLDTNEARLSFLTDLGWQVTEEPLETLQFLLPNPLTLAYLTYNELQLAQGYDLTPYAGAAVTRYTYSVENYPDRTSGVQLNLYLYEDTPIAGDIICPGAEGFQASLVFPVTQ